MLLCRKAKIDNQGRIAIPKSMLEDAGLKPGDVLYITVDDVQKNIYISKGGEKE